MKEKFRHYGFTGDKAFGLLSSSGFTPLMVAITSIQQGE
jgi:hypothetical protein